MTLTKLSYSSLSTFADCGEQFRRLKIEEMEGESHTQENARGKLLHRWLQYLTEEHLRLGKWHDEAEMAASLDDIWKNGFKDINGFNPLLETQWNDEFLITSYNDSFKLIDQINDFLHNIVPVAAEQHVEIDLPVPGVNITQLHGFIDLQAAPNIIIDWKTKKSPMNESWLAADLQATVYTALLGLPKATVNFAQLVFLKRKPPRLQVATTTRDERHTNWLLYTHIPSVIDAIEKETFVANPGWKCFFCGVPCGAMPDIQV